ncbi:MAG: methylenetetrahydrofolate reductase C-terminal domain-containing protein [Solirubrobacteraceae bacterium]|nr:methylenetetrahydrofolate reductase C-terminal domain-containing protein [Solirubrobacteraceae bacterium]
MRVDRWGGQTWWIVGSCPKHMTHGPCGGVQDDGSCEAGGPCAFVEPAAAPHVGTLVATETARASWEHGRVSTPPERELGETAAALHAQLELDAVLNAKLGPDSARPYVVADLPSAGVGGGVSGAAAADAERRLAAGIAGSVDAVLLGDAPWARVQLPPAVRGANVAGEGVVPWCGLNARDRNRAALESELAALDASGIPAVHCVTGDHPSLGNRPDVRPVFDLDSTGIVRLAARTTPLLISAAEAPAAVPQSDRPARAAAKIAAGAQVLFINHCSPEECAAFVAALSVIAPHPTVPGYPAVPLIACVPLVISHGAADRIAKYLGHAPSPDLLAALDAPDPRIAAVDLAVAHARRLLEIPGIAGIDLSAPAGPGEAEMVVASLALAGRELAPE